MKGLSIVCAVILILGLIVSPTIALQYRTDVLESGNPGGWTESLKTFDDEWTLNVGEVVELDIWINDFPEELSTAGFWITYDPSLVSIEDVIAYDSNDLIGPWSSGFTTKVQDPAGPGTYLLMLGRFYGAPLDADEDILFSRIRFRCETEGNVTITVSVDPGPGLSLLVGWPSGYVYDHEILPNAITLYQTRCSVDVDCDDSDNCTTDSCNPSTGTCSFDPAIDCDDSDPCTTDSCDPSTGECVFNPVDCNDSDACTADSCNPSTGECMYNSVDCNFGYSADFLESGNPGGWTSSLKTFEDEWTLSPGEDIEVDIWLNDVPELMSFGGFWIEYDPSLVSIIEIKAYDGDLEGTAGLPSPCCSGLSGPWNPEFTEQIPNPEGPGTYIVSLGPNDCIAHDAGGDIIFARVRVRCESLGDATITVKPIPVWNTVIGCNGPTYDPQITSHNIILHQYR